ncbi:MAG: bifunctional phosphoribosyl-AMP cyclohydrolase/phosphoribosyl-ATP diphosphatase HisIE [Pseudomonadota bacterium]
MSLEPDRIDLEKAGGLVPAVVQHVTSGVLLMVGFMDRAALDATLASGKVTFFSRSKGRLWTKGETTGHHLEVVAVDADCDNDTIRVLARPHGPACHRGTPTCFDPAPQPTLAFLAALDDLVATRERERPAGSYTTKLFDAGVRHIAQKVGEEGVETALAAVAQDGDALTGEAADLVFHLLVLLRSRGLSLADVVAELAKRHSPAS